MDKQPDFITETKLSGVFIIKRPKFEDTRGFFREFYRKESLDERTGLSFDPVQANHSHSNNDTLRGIHIAPWHKLITVTAGQVQQIVVDTRPQSQTFGQYESILLDDQNAVFVPAGCGNGFLALTPQVDYIYLATDYWSPGAERYLLFNDPDINIQWQSESPIVSDKDLTNKPLKELFPEKFL